tara:strand:- start:632 stop:2035 length:1404 start_codon:yes stop_codon:yes gene_type:complete
MRVMPISDSPWAPTGFGTNTKNIACILAEEGHKVGYGGCQNPTYQPDHKIPWPLGQTEKTVSMELLPILHQGQEKFGEKSFDEWEKNFKPDVCLTHLDIQMFSWLVQRKLPTHANIPLRENNKWLTSKQRKQLFEKMWKEVVKGPKWKIASIIPIDGQPSIPAWIDILREVDYPVAMSRYGEEVLKEDFKELPKEWFDRLTYIPHGVDCNLFKPLRDVQKPDNAFVIGCVARNQHRKNIPRLMKAFKYFVDENNLKPKGARLMLHMDWQDYMGWNIEYMANYYDMQDYLLPPMMGKLDEGGGVTEEKMVEIYNLMDIFALPTAGEGFGIPTAEALACGKPVVITNYTSSYELVGAEKPEDDIPLWPQGNGPINGRDHLIDEDWSDRGCLVPYKDMWWDTPARAAPQRAIVSERGMAEAFSRYYNDRSLVLEHGKNARNYARKNYDWNGVVAEKWINLFKRIEKETGL